MDFDASSVERRALSLGLCPAHMRLCGDAVKLSASRSLVRDGASHCLCYLQASDHFEIECIPVGFECSETMRRQPAYMEFLQSRPLFADDISSFT